jgi:hypothetical protein
LIHRELKSCSTILHSVFQQWKDELAGSKSVLQHARTIQDLAYPLLLALASRSLPFGVSFASARQISQHFRASHYIIKEMLGRQLDLKRFSPRRLPSRRSDDQKAARARDLRALLPILPCLQNHSFEGISNGDESLFLYEY